MVIFHGHVSLPEGTCYGDRHGFPGVWSPTPPCGLGARLGGYFFHLFPKTLASVELWSGTRWNLIKDMGMGQYLLIPFLGEWTSIYQLFWCSPGVQGFDTLPYVKIFLVSVGYFGEWLFTSESQLMIICDEVSELTTICRGKLCWFSLWCNHLSPFL